MLRSLIRPTSLYSLLLLGLTLSACAPKALLRPGPGEDLRLPGEAARAVLGQDTRHAGELLKQRLNEQPGDFIARWYAAQLARMAGDREGAFEQWLAAAGCDHPLAGLAMLEAQHSASMKKQEEALARVLRAVRASPQRSPLLKARAAEVLGHTLRGLGKPEAARRAFDSLDLLRNWMVLGPFDNDQNAGFATAYAPEKELRNFDGSYQGKLHKIRWRPVEHLGYDGRVPLESLLDPPRWATAYLVSHIHSDRARDLAIRLGAYRSVKVWMNGRLLLSDDQAKRAQMDQHVVGARLQKGWNRLMVKVCQSKGRWQLRLRLTEPSGSPLKGIRSVRSWQDIQQGSAEGSPAIPQSPRRWLESPERRQVPSLAVIRAWWLYRLGFRKEALSSLLTVSQDHPDSPLIQVLLADMQFSAGQEGRALKSLGRALKLAPGLPRAILRRVEHETDSKRPERAMGILEPLLKLDPVPQDAESYRALLLLRRGWYIDALRVVERSIKARPDRAWTWKVKSILHRRLGQRDSALRATRRALALQADDASALDWLIEDALDRHRIDEALAHVRHKQRLWPSNVSAILREAQILLAAERLEAAQRALARAIHIAPMLWRNYRLDGDRLYRQGKRALAIQAYEKALALHPDNPQLREYLDFLQQRKDLVFERFAMPEADIQQILDAPPSLSRHREADAVFLLDDHITHVFGDGSAKHLVRQIYFVRSAKGQRQLSRLRVPASSSFKLIVAETVLPDGSRQEATSIQKGAIHMPNVQPGSILHVAYRYESSSTSWMEDHFAMSFNFQGAYPSRRARWVVVLPDDKKINFHIRGDFVHHAKEQLNAEQAHIFSAQKAPMIHREAWRPPLRDIRAAVYLSTVPSWEALARWQNSLIQDQFDIDEDIRQTTRRLVEGKKTKAEQIDAIYRFVAREIRYLDHDRGIMGKKPNKAINIFENRFGDCKDKATLMIAMLRELGIEAHYAAVRTRDAGRVLWQVPFAQSNHIITYIPTQPGFDKDWFVDGTSRYGHYAYLSSRDQDIQALVLTGEDHKMVRTPRMPARASSMNLSMQARLEGDKLLAMEAEERWTGLFASSYRRALVTEGKRPEEFAKRLNRRYPGAQLQELRFEGLERLEFEAKAHYRFKAPGRVRREGDQLRVDLLYRSRLVESYAPRSTRRSDLFTMQAYRKTVTIHLDLPAELEVASLPAGHRVDNDLLRFELTWSQEGQRVQVSQTLVWKKRIIPKERYALLRQMLMDADQAEEQDLVLKRRQVAQRVK